MDYPITTIGTRTYSPLLAEIPDAPETLFVRGNHIAHGMRCLAVVGSRDYTNYGKEVVEYLIHGLRGYPIAIISGLAIGIDTFAHESALSAQLYTLAVPGSGIDDSVIYPSRNKGLAHRILKSGGGLMSEYEPTFQATQWSFPRRNRIMVGLAHAVLLIEAGEKSGTLITARLTAEYNRELLVVPGNIFSDNSKGVHQFLKLGATPITTPADILDVLGIAPEETTAQSSSTYTDEESQLLEILSEPKDHDTLIRLLPFPPKDTLTLLMKMELNGHIHEENGIYRRAA